MTDRPDHIVRITEWTERRWRRMAKAAALTVAGSLAGVLAARAAGILLGFALGVAAYAASWKAERHVQEIDPGTIGRERK